MNRNQKIALGCGGAGCLGLIVVIAAGAILYFAYQRRPAGYRANRNANFNTNRRLNSNSSADSSEDSSSSSLSDDARHKLFQAVSVTQDAELIERVQKKLGLLKANGAPADEYTRFMKDHVVWLFKNTDFLQSVNTPEKGRAYVDEHIND
jgi:uncharacterized protein HemX